jgi:hypothetical protein
MCTVVQGLNHQLSDTLVSQPERAVGAPGEFAIRRSEALPGTVLFRFQDTVWQCACQSPSREYGYIVRHPMRKASSRIDHTGKGRRRDRLPHRRI